MSIDTSTAPARPPGFFARMAQHPKGFWFFFWGEFAERCSYYGMAAILVRYMEERLSLGEGWSVVGMSLFKAGAYFCPLIGGWLADRYFGKYWTIVGFCIPYIMGHFILGFENIGALIVALALLAMGSGVIKPNISTLMGMTYDQQRPGQEILRSSAFSFFYLAINIGAAISQLAMPVIRTNYDYWIAFLFPAGLMVVSFAIFALGKPFYARETILPALPPEERRERWRVLKAVALLFFPIVFFWAVFDQSHSVWVLFARDYLAFPLDLGIYDITEADQMQAINPILIMILLPPMTWLFVALANRGFNIRATDKMMLGFLLTAGVLVVLVVSAQLAGEAETRTVTAKFPTNEVVLSIKGDKGIREWRGQVSRPDAAKPDLITAELTDGEQKAAIKGVLKAKENKQLTLSEAGPALAWLNGRSFDEGKAVDTRFVEPSKKASAWWQVLAYLVLTIAEILISVTGLELAFVVAPQSMKSFITAVWLAVVGIANFAVNTPLAYPYRVLSPTAFFGLQIGIMAAVILSFYFIARRFNRAQAEAMAARAGGGPEMPPLPTIRPTGKPSS